MDSTNNSHVNIPTSVFNRGFPFEGFLLLLTETYVKPLFYCLTIYLLKPQNRL